MYAEDQAKSELVTDRVSPPTMTQRLYQERDELERRLAMVNEAIEAVEADPDAMRIVDAVSKLGHLGY